MTAVNELCRERAIDAAVSEMSLFTGNLEMKVRKAIERYELVLRAECCWQPAEQLAQSRD